MRRKSGCSAGCPGALLTPVSPRTHLELIVDIYHRGYPPGRVADGVLGAFAGYGTPQGHHPVFYLHLDVDVRENRRVRVDAFVDQITDRVVVERPGYSGPAWPANGYPGAGTPVEDAGPRSCS